MDEKAGFIKPHEGTEKRKKQRGRRAEDAPDNIPEQETDHGFHTHADTYYDFMEKTSSWEASTKK